MTLLGLCERLHCLPGALLREDFGLILRGLGGLDLYHALHALQNGEALTAAQNRAVGEVLQLDLEAQKNA